MRYNSTKREALQSPNLISFSHSRPIFFSHTKTPLQICSRTNQSSVTYKMPTSLTPLFSLVLVIFFVTLFSSSQLKLAHANGCSENSTNVEKGMKLLPLNQEKLHMMVMNETRRKLGSFQICSLCTCCGARGYCLPSPCCYAINCNIPNRPFGFCSFTPKTCNCFGCHL